MKIDPQSRPKLLGDTPPLHLGGSGELLMALGSGVSVTTFIGFVLLGLAVGFGRIRGLRVVVIWCDCETEYRASTGCGSVVRCDVCSEQF
jgi:hypothetical protein